MKHDSDDRISEKDERVERRRRNIFNNIASLTLQCTTSWIFTLDMFSLFFVHCPKVISCIFLDEEVNLQLYYVPSLCGRGADNWVRVEDSC